MLCYNAKPVVYGSLAAGWDGRRPRCYSMITGLNSAFAGRGPRQAVARRAQLFLYRRALRYNAARFFQNPGDEQVFSDHGLIAPRTECVRIQGSGVNPDRYPRQPLPPPGRQITFTMVARLIVEKGVRESPEAARRINPEAWLVNVSRGGVVDDTALLKSLRRGALAGAVLDVFEREPLDAGHPYWAMPNVLVTPHVSGTSDRYMQRAMEVFRRNLRQLEETGCLATPVDIRLGY